MQQHGLPHGSMTDFMTTIRFHIQASHHITSPVITHSLSPKVDKVRERACNGSLSIQPRTTQHCHDHHHHFILQDHLYTCLSLHYNEKPQLSWPIATQYLPPPKMSFYPLTPYLLQLPFMCITRSSSLLANNEGSGVVGRLNWIGIRCLAEEVENKWDLKELAGKIMAGRRQACEISEWEAVVK